MGFSGRADPDAYDRQLLEALKRRASYYKGNRAIELEGDIQYVETHYGPYVKLFGTVTARLHGTRIFGVDFVNRRLTTYNIELHPYGNSMTTQANTQGWRYSFGRIFGLQLPPKDVQWYSRRWTAASREETMFTRYRERMPWFYRDERGIIWFEWEKYDEALEWPLHTSSSFLREDQNHRYFEYYWDEQGVWTRRFINEDAARRWKQREKKRKKAGGELSASVPGTP